MGKGRRTRSLRAIHWDERKHPRDNQGKFAHKGGSRWLAKVVKQVGAQFGDINMGHGGPTSRTPHGTLQSSKAGGFVLDTKSLSQAARKAPVGDLKVRDHARVSGEDQYGKATTLNGFVQGTSDVTVRKGTKRTPMKLVQMSETPSGAGGWRGQVLVPHGAEVERTKPSAEVARLEGEKIAGGLTGRKPGGGTVQVLNPDGQGGFKAEGSISREEAAKRMGIDTSRVGRQAGGVTTTTSDNSGDILNGMTVVKSSGGWAVRGNEADRKATSGYLYTSKTKADAEDWARTHAAASRAMKAGNYAEAERITREREAALVGGEGRLYRPQGDVARVPNDVAQRRAAEFQRMHEQATGGPKVEPGKTPERTGRTPGGGTVTNVLPPTQRAALAKVDASEVGKERGLHPGEIAVPLRQKLLAAGLIEGRETNGPLGRRTYLHLTPAGHEALKAAEGEKYAKRRADVAAKAEKVAAQEAAQRARAAEVRAARGAKLAKDLQVARSEGLDETAVKIGGLDFARKEKAAKAAKAEAARKELLLRGVPEYTPGQGGGGESATEVRTQVNKLTKQFAKDGFTLDESRAALGDKARAYADAASALDRARHDVAMTAHRRDYLRTAGRVGGDVEGYKPQLDQANADHRAALDELTRQYQATTAAKDAFAGAVVDMYAGRGRRKTTAALKLPEVRRDFTGRMPESLQERIDAQVPTEARGPEADAARRAVMDRLRLEDEIAKARRAADIARSQRSQFFERERRMLPQAESDAKAEQLNKLATDTAARLRDLEAGHRNTVAAQDKALADLEAAPRKGLTGHTYAQVVEAVKAASVGGRSHRNQEKAWKADIRKRLGLPDPGEEPMMAREQIEVPHDQLKVGDFIGGAHGGLGFQIASIKKNDDGSTTLAGIGITGVDTRTLKPDETGPLKVWRPGVSDQNRAPLQPQFADLPLMGQRMLEGYDPADRATMANRIRQGELRKFDNGTLRRIAADMENGDATDEEAANRIDRVIATDRTLSADARDKLAATSKALRAQHRADLGLDQAPPPGSKIETTRTGNIKVPEATKQARRALRAESQGGTTSEPPPVSLPKTTSTPVYDKLLATDGPQAIQSKAMRGVVEQMEAHGWELSSQNPQLRTTTWKAPDGRTLSVQFINGKKPLIQTSDSYNAPNVTFKAALAHVVTPTPPEITPSANVEDAMRNVGLTPIDPAYKMGGYGHNDPLFAPLREAQRDLHAPGSYGGRGKTAQEAAAGLRAAAERYREAAKRADELRGGGGLRDVNSARREELANQFDRIAAELERMDAAHQASVAEVDRLKTLPPDIRPGRSALATLKGGPGKA